MNEAMQSLLAMKKPDIGFPMLLVGGAVRDALLGVDSKDWDFAVEAPDFPTLVATITEWVQEPRRVFDVKDETFTVRAQHPDFPPLDFVMCRQDGPYSDGRHPDFVNPGTFLDDSNRRDFSVNSMGLDLDSGDLFDPNGGHADLMSRTLRFVGDAEQRVREDALRILRAFRFEVTKGLTPEPSTWDACTNAFAVEMLGEMKLDRVREELEKCFKHDTLATFRLLERAGEGVRAAIFRDGLRMTATSAKAVNR